MNPNPTVHRIAILQGHPDPTGNHLCHALARAYALGAQEAGHQVQQFDIAKLEFPLLRTRESFEQETVPPGLVSAQEAIGKAHHLLIVYPL